MEKPIRLSVRSVVEQVLRAGDIDSRFASPLAAMMDGAKAHRRLQKSMGSGYNKEVSLNIRLNVGGIPVLLHGRADGVWEEDGVFTIDEIKTTSSTLEKLFAQQELHLAQAKCYAYMLLQGMENPPASVHVQLTYFQLDTEELARHLFTYTTEEVSLFFHDLMARYGVWLRFRLDWKELRDASIRKAPFPFLSYRRGQRELAVAAYSAIELGRNLYAQAPTGIGKTLSALFPSIKAMGEGRVERLFYLTAKTVTRGVAEDAIRRMAKDGLRLKSLTLRAKEKICPQERVNCTPAACPYAQGHFDRVNGALMEILQTTDLITPEAVLACAKTHRVCPHEFALDIAEWADLVIGDYNHVFDPRACLKRFFQEPAGDSYVFLIDEAHNLPDRVRAMYTASVEKAPFSRLPRALTEKDARTKRLKSAMRKVNAHLLALQKDHTAQGEWASPQPDAALSPLLLEFTGATEPWLAERQAHPLHSEVLSLYFEMLAFSSILSGYGDHYRTIFRVRGTDVRVTLYCLDPSGLIEQKLRLARASLFFSATLTPLAYYRDMLGGKEEDGILSLPSPFDENRLLLIAHGGVSTRYADRAASVQPVCESIKEAVSGKRGNYLIFFPSHAYMRAVHEIFTSRYPNFPTLLQQGEMDEEARAHFLRQFRAENEGTLLGFSVLGGIFSEGIDLIGEKLIGAVIVGAGLPMVSLRQNLIREYFDQKNGAGFEYAYVYPGMNKVLQAAGRVIRSEEDCGMVLLIDSRFHTPKYRALFPPHWSQMQYIRHASALPELLASFSHFQSSP